MTHTSAETARARLVTQLTHDGVLRDPAWVAAFAETPRHEFVPYYFEAHTDRPGWRLVEDSDEWQDGVYRNVAHTTQLDNTSDAVDAARRGQTVKGQPTSSSSAPSLMALMLEALDVHDGHHVLEIGTGTGYNTALLCHRLGGQNVTSVDVDPLLVSEARERLAQLGHKPYVAAVDGYRGCPIRAPFDRIIAAVGVHRIPTAWMDQMRSGGVILAPLDLAGTGGLLARLAVDGRRAEGRFLSDYGSFMPTRDQQKPSATIPDPDGDIDYEPATVPIEAVTGGTFDFFAALITGGYDWIGFTPNDGSAAETWITRQDGSWACHTTDQGHDVVRQGGPARVWDEIEAAYWRWQRLGQPVRERFGLTVDRHGQHRVWLDRPSDVITAL